MSKKTEYRTVDTSTEAGLKQAERLHQRGWKTARVGLFTIQFYRQPQPQTKGTHMKSRKTKSSKPRRPKMSTAERLGLERLPKLTVNSCEVRAKQLKAGLEKGKYKGETADLARRHAYWYASKANQLKSKKS